LSAATKGLPLFSMPRIRACSSSVKRVMACASLKASSMFRSPPAMNSGLAEVTITPLTAGSAMARRTAAA